LDGRREVGLITTDRRVARRIAEVFEADWAHAKGDKAAEKEAISPVAAAAG
jgi:hypothetical protein